MNKANLKNILNSYIFGCTILLGVGYLLINSSYVKLDMLIYITFLWNFIIILYNLFKINKVGYSLNEILYLFLFIFMIIAPFLQYINNSFPWWDTYLISDNIIIKSNIIILVFIIMYEISKKLPYKNKNNLKYIVNIKNIEDILFYISIISAIYIIANTGFTNLFSRKTNDLNMSQSIGLIVSTTVRAIPLVTLMLYINNIKNYKLTLRKRLRIIILSIIFILLFFPTALSRYQVAVAYISILCTIKPIIKNKYIFKYAIIGGLLVIFPIINLFRNYTWEQVFSLKLYDLNIGKEFLSGDFDAYSMLCRSIIYGTSKGVTYGNQALGAILFFIPRVIWPTKAVGSGYLMAEGFGWEFKNVSCPYIAEGYINFGLIGVILFALILGKIIRTLDIGYYKYIKSDNRRIYFIGLYYPIILGMLFFILRGDLLSSMAYTVGHIIPIIFIYTIDRCISYISNKNYL